MQNTQVFTQSGGISTGLALSASTVVKASKGRVARISVTTAGAAGAIYDSATVGGASASNLIAVVPATVGIYILDFPVQTGITYIPGASQVASISFY